jgi:hypothetical protein
MGSEESEWLSAFSADLVTALTNDPQRVAPAGGQALAEALVEGMARGLVESGEEGDENRWAATDSSKPGVLQEGPAGVQSGSAWGNPLFKAGTARASSARFRGSIFAHNGK